jgi:hypothetical protein
MRIASWLTRIGMSTLWLSSLAVAAHAQQMPALPTGVRIVLATCDRIVPKQALLEQLRIELLSTGVVDIEVVDPDTGAARSAQKAERIATLQVYFPECEDDAGMVNLRISDRLTAKYVERALVVTDVTRDARPRAVALAIVELLRASWLELVIAQGPGEGDDSSNAVRNRLVSHLKQTTDNETPDGDEEDPSRASARERELRLASNDAAVEERWKKKRLEWLGGGRLYPQGGGGDLSTMVKLSIALNRVLRLHTGALAAGGGLNADKKINAFEAAGVIGMSIAGGTQPEVEVASICEVGWSRMSGQSIKDVSRVAAVGTLLATVRTPVSRGVDVIAGVQAGFVLSPVVVKTGAGKTEKIAGGQEGPVIGVVVGLAGIL